jgi:hypothetical protein
MERAAVDFAEKNSSRPLSRRLLALWLQFASSFRKKKK